jgi:hypothetical protein
VLDLRHRGTHARLPQGVVPIDYPITAGVRRPVVLPRGHSGTSIAARHEAARRRVSSSQRQAELVEHAVRTLDEQLSLYRVDDADGVLHATARAMLAVACDTEGYDVAFAAASGQVAVRVRRSTFGLEVDVVGPAPLGR